MKWTFSLRRAMVMTHTHAKKSTYSSTGWVWYTDWHRVETADPHGRTDTTDCSTFPLTPLATDLLVNRFCIENSEEIWRNDVYSGLYWTARPSVLWRCWLGGRKGIRPVKNWVVGCWHGYVSGARCRLAYGPADATATATHCLAPVKSRLVLSFWYRLTQVDLEKGSLNVHAC